MNEMKHKILALPGDGIGQEVMDATLEVLDFLSSQESLDIDLTIMPVGGSSYDQYGVPLTNDALNAAKQSDAILFGAVGAPQYDNLAWDKRPEHALLALRKGLNLFANLRPAFLFNELADASSLKADIIKDLDILIVRELTGGLYFGEPRGIYANVSPKRALNTMVYDEVEIDRIARVAFEAAARRKNKVCSVDKANVLEVSKFWREQVSALHAKEFSEQELSHMLADNAAMQLVIDPNQFDVILASNLFGDILSDIAATLTGSIGMLPSASLNEKNVGMYEPCHGSAPDIAGEGIANPIAMILSLSMAMRYSLDMGDLADKVDEAVKTFITNGGRTKDIAAGGAFLKTHEVGQEIIQILS
jgi:3-isopropylmalate dehydrogenase